MARTNNGLKLTSEDPKIPQTLWNKIAFLKLSEKEKDKLSRHIDKECESDQLYWVQILISTLIATFGLLQNSVAVIIGAMLIAPMLRPIQGVAFSLTSGSPKKFFSSGKLLIWTIIVSISTAAVFAWIVPLRVETSEIIARTAPNLLDLFIAISSAIIAILALTYKKLSESIAGVAMAASLAPPLAVVGIELSLFNFTAAGGAFFLFITNLFAILFVGVLIFLMYGFNPHQKDKQWQTIENFAVLVALIIFISVPLYSSLVDISEKITIETKAREVITQSLSENIPKARLETLLLESFSSDSAQLRGVIKIPENENFFSETRESIRKQLGQSLGRNVTFSVEIIPIASIISIKEQEQQNAVPIEEKIRSSIQKYLSENFPEAIIIDLEITQMETEEKLSWLNKVIFSLPPGQEFTEDLEFIYSKEIEALFPEEKIQNIWVFLGSNGATKTPSESTPAQAHYEKMSLEWEKFFNDKLPQDCSLKNFQLTWTFPNGEIHTKTEIDFSKIESYTISFDLYAPRSTQVDVARFKRAARLFANNLHSKPTTINIRAFIFDQETITTFNGNDTEKPSE